MLKFCNKLFCAHSYKTTFIVNDRRWNLCTISRTITISFLKEALCGLLVRRIFRELQFSFFRKVPGWPNFRSLRSFKRGDAIIQFLAPPLFAHNHYWGNLKRQFLLFRISGKISWLSLILLSDLHHRCMKGKCKHRKLSSELSFTFRPFSFTLVKFNTPTSILSYYSTCKYQRTQRGNFQSLPSLLTLAGWQTLAPKQIQKL